MKTQRKKGDKETSEKEEGDMRESEGRLGNSSMLACKDKSLENDSCGEVKSTYVHEEDEEEEEEDYEEEEELASEEYIYEEDSDIERDFLHLTQAQTFEKPSPVPYRSLSHAAARERMTEIIRESTELLNVDDDVAALLLGTYRWHADDLIQEWFSDQASVLAKARLPASCLKEEEEPSLDQREEVPLPSSSSSSSSSSSVCKAKRSISQASCSDRDESTPSGTTRQTTSMNDAQLPQGRRTSPRLRNKSISSSSSPPSASASSGSVETETDTKRRSSTTDGTPESPGVRKEKEKFASSSSATSAVEGDAEGRMFDCPITTLRVPLEETAALPCGHRFSNEGGLCRFPRFMSIPWECTYRCWRMYLKAALDEGPESAVEKRCPSFKCGEIVRESFWKRFVPPWQLDRLHDFQLRLFIERHPSFSWCPAPGCTYAVELCDTTTTTSAAPTTRGLPSSSSAFFSPSSSSSSPPPASTATASVDQSRSSSLSASSSCADSSHKTLQDEKTPENPTSSPSASLSSSSSSRADNDQPSSSSFSSPRTKKAKEQQDEDKKRSHPDTSSSSSSSSSSYVREVSQFSYATHRGTGNGLQGGDVSCACGMRFCLYCGEEPHRPVPCEIIRNWLLKNQSEADNMTWILVHTKNCPRCKQPIEKNQGCMHMTCRCGYEFCWLCLGDWKKHQTSNFYRCNIYEQRPPDPNEEKRKKAEESLERYAHYFERYGAHSHGQRVASERQIAQMLKHMRALSQRTLRDVSEVEFLENAVKQIVECRRMLKWSYAFGFFAEWPEAHRKDLFEYHQGQLERSLDLLQEKTETFDPDDFLEGGEDGLHRLQIFKAELIDLTRVIGGFFRNICTVFEDEFCT
ncbi:ariadne family protein [Cystoisospora suis]|uniref:RBR-type E3 ubiquitin transferase n=1 Tax=Cystoisospora suis TaxID=483139 RepID=A0A2C6LGB3_9APIC|nr:ariadne family protein [Cystoisospora suis]